MPQLGHSTVLEMAGSRSPLSSRKSAPVSVTACDLAGHCTTKTVTPPTPTEVCGDQNADGVVDVSDVIIDLRIVVGLVVPTDEQEKLSDVVRDGQINIFDVIQSLRHLVGLTEITECGP